MTDTPKKRPGRWRPGQSGNPKGRPKGVGLAGDVRARLGDRLAEVVDALLIKAVSGDVQAARAVLDRCIPVLRPIEPGTALPTLANAETLNDGARAVLNAAASGDLGAGTAAQLVGALAALARSTEMAELAARIERLEGGHDGDID